VRGRLEDDPELLRLGPEAVLYAVLDQVVDDYAPVVAGLENEVSAEVIRSMDLSKVRIHRYGHFWCSTSLNRTFDGT
jgi:Mg2+ and Co2+ transporter CorA